MEAGETRDAGDEDEARADGGGGGDAEGAGGDDVRGAELGADADDADAQDGAGRGSQSRADPLRQRHRVVDPRAEQDGAWDSRYGRADRRADAVGEREPRLGHGQREAETGQRGDDVGDGADKPSKEAREGATIAMNHHASSTCSRSFHPEARPRVRASAACIHGARSAPRARELVVTPPLVAARAKRAPAARQETSARAGCDRQLRVGTPETRVALAGMTRRADGPLHVPDTSSSARRARKTRPHDRRSRRRNLPPRPSARARQRRARRRARRPRGRSPASQRSSRHRGRPDLSHRRWDAETTSAPAAEEDGVREFFDTQMVDEAGMLAASTFPIPPADLIAKCKLILAKNNGGEDPSLLASDFKFVAPVVGPLEKERFLAAFQSFKIDEGFPDAKFNYYHFRVDPFEPSRVWYDARFVGTNTGPLIGGTLPATNKKVESPPQSCSMRFNERGSARS